MGLAFPTLAGFGIVWEEWRPRERGRVALVVLDAGGEVRELLPPEMSARTTVHEYGGRAWSVGGPGLERLVTSNFVDQCLWDVSPGSSPRPLTPPAPDGVAARFANPAISPDGTWVVAVREVHAPGNQVVNDLVAVLLDGHPNEPRVIATGHDFYSSPSFSADGRQLAFVCWDHPDMPWDRAQIWRGTFREGALADLVAVVGQGTEESAAQPRWSPNGLLHYVSDRSGWWNLYDGEHNLAPLEAEFAGPAWAFGDADYAFLASGDLVAGWRSDGTGRIGVVRDGRADNWPLPYTSFWHIAPGPSRKGTTGAVLTVAGSPKKAAEIVMASDDGVVEVLRRSRQGELPPGSVSVGEPFTFPTGEGERAHGIYYPPRNPEYSAPAGEGPPLVVTTHGGPTGSANRNFNLAVQFWTSRGFAVADVDYRGSAGYGRAYRRALDGRWGLADVEDCALAARWLARQGRADGKRMVIKGASSAGLTVLVSLARYREFAAGAVRFPVTELGALAVTTHKFESRYLDSLVPKDQFEARSPLTMAGEIEAPVLFMHGADDNVAPRSQSRLMVSAMREAGKRALLIEIEGEGHGFRRAETIVRAQEAELAFFARAVGIEPADDLTQACLDLEVAARPAGALWPAGSI